MINPQQILKWLFLRVLPLTLLITAVLERLANLTIIAAFQLRGMDVPPNTYAWLQLGWGMFSTAAGNLPPSELPPSLLRVTNLLPTEFGLWLAEFSVMLPGVVALAAAVLLAGWYVKSLYGLKNIQAGSEFVLRSLFGTLGFKPGLIFRAGGEEVVAVGGQSRGADSVLRKVGGPGNLLLENNTAVLLERGGKFTRVVHTPGLVRLRRFERVYQSVDLRPQVWPFTVSALSKEGLPIQCQVNVHFQIDPGGLTPTPETPYPVTAETIFTAATATWVREENWLEDQLNWAGRVLISHTEGTLRSIIARTPLDQLVPSQIPDPKSSSKPSPPQKVRGKIQAELFSALKSSSAQLGVKIIAVGLQDIEVGEAIQEQWEDIWRTGWRSWATEMLGTGKAMDYQQLEGARIDTKIEFITTVAHALDQARLTGQLSKDLVALQVIDSLRHLGESGDSLERTALPDETINALDHLQEMLS
ncbi:MAG TPA: SPFH domain-containing protein [Thermoflexia bacterium]|nr:SPFH domain-containing protein [Thermoflexia bacterium]